MYSVPTLPLYPFFAISYSLMIYPLGNDLIIIENEAKNISIFEILILLVHSFIIKILPMYIDVIYIIIILMDLHPSCVDRSGAYLHMLKY